MASLRRSRLVQPGLQEAPRPRRFEGRRWLPAAAVIGAALLALAWLDGGETPLRPIAEVVELPGQGQ